MIEIKRAEHPIEWRAFPNREARAWDLYCTSRPNYHWYFHSKEECLSLARERAGGSGALFVVADADGYAESSLAL